MAIVKIFRSRDEYMRWLKFKDDKVKITSVVCTPSYSEEDSFFGDNEIYTVTCERRPVSDSA